MKLSLGQAVYLGNKVLIGFQVDTLVFQVHCSLLYHHISDTGSGNISGGDCALCRGLLWLLPHHYILSYYHLLLGHHHFLGCFLFWHNICTG